MIVWNHICLTKHFINEYKEINTYEWHDFYKYRHLITY